MEHVISTDDTTIGASSEATIKLTRMLLEGGVVAGPLYIVVGVIQMFIRPGFDIRRHALSLLSNGDLGWIQIANFIVTGVLLIAGAVGVKRAVQSGPAKTWGPLLLGLFGLGMIGGGIFTADPAMGFPPGTPVTATSISWHGMMHLIVGSVGFLGFIVACFVFARHFNSLGQPGWAAYSVIAGVLFLVTFAGLASGSVGTFSLPFFLAATFGFIWISLVLNRLRAAPKG
jgi:hypothetical membrane protein